MIPEKNEQFAYIINKPIFVQLVAPMLERELNFKAKLLLQIQITLPYYFPFQDKQPILLNTNKKTCILLQFIKKINPCPPIIREMVSKSILNGDKYSIVEFNFFSSENSFIDDNDDSLPDLGNWVLKDCITILNDFAMTFSLKYNDFGVYRINPLMIRKFHQAQIVNLENWKTDTIAIVTPDILNKKQIEISQEETNNFPKVVDTYRKSNHVFMFYQELSARAMRNLNQGNLREALINRQTSIEVFFSILLRFKYTYDGGDQEMVNELIKSKGIAHAISSNMPEFLGGPGFNNTDGTPFKAWKTNCYELRNTAIHNGHNPTIPETNLAFDSCNVFIHYTLHRIKRNKKKYPGMYEMVPLKYPGFKIPELMKKYFK